MLQNDSLSYEEMKNWDLVNYLSEMGFEPHHYRGNDYWYCSPLRTEKNPSFKITRKHNLWYDHGLGKGGTIIDFIMAFYNCSLKEVLQKAVDEVGFHHPLSHTLFVPLKAPERKIEIHSVQSIKSLLLERYLRRRNITIDLGKKWCKEVHFSFSEKQYTALGFLNHSGGWELRNDWFKGSSSPKDLSLLQNNHPELTVFEGFFDFLSYQKLTLSAGTDQQDFLILNSTSFVERAIPIIGQYSSVKLFLDRDDTGLKCTKRLQEAVPNCTDESHLYKGFKDINDWLARSHAKSLTQPLSHRR